MRLKYIRIETQAFAVEVPIRLGGYDADYTNMKIILVYVKKISCLQIRSRAVTAILT